jgi:iron-sulfur cluster repair protein YtfE (RIC family)
MTVFTILKQDHKKVAALFKEIKSTTSHGRKTRADLFDQIKFDLDVHTKVEEDILYPICKDFSQTHKLALEAYEEHHIAKVLLKELATMDKDTEEWMAKLITLEENIAHHIKEEEKELFPKTEDKLNKDQIQALTDQIKEMKQRYEDQNEYSILERLYRSVVGRE